MLIRLGTEEDLPQVLGIDRESAPVDGVGGRAPHALQPDGPIDPAYFLWQRGMMVAETEGRVVGYVLSHLVEWMHGIDRLAWIEHIGVHPDFRRRGIGLALLRFTEAHYRGRARTLYAEIHPHNAKSLALFRKFAGEMVERVLAFKEL